MHFKVCKAWIPRSTFVTSDCSSKTSIFPRFELLIVSSYCHFVLANKWIKSLRPQAFIVAISFSSSEVVVTFFYPIRSRFKVFGSFCQFARCPCSLLICRWEHQTQCQKGLGELREHTHHVHGPFELPCKVNLHLGWIVRIGENAVAVWRWQTFPCDHDSDFWNEVDKKGMCGILARLMNFKKELTY